MSIEELEALEPPLPPDKPEVGAYPASCPVIGLGASAGGLEAFQAFLSNVSEDSGCAYVLVQHLDPNHESMLAELLSRRTPLPVRQITDGMEIAPNSVYLIPPNQSLTIEKALLRLTDFSEPRGFRRPIDVFFRSLAIDQGPNAACIVLSGTGGDGAEGLRTVKEAGGLTLVQQPDSAKYDGMPKAAVATGLVDKVLSVRDMPATLRDYFDRSLSARPVTDGGEFLLKVCDELRRRLGHDFSQYKRATMLRRVQRRMQVLGVAHSGEYLRRLSENEKEAELLFRDLLINVTCFFRDAEAFDCLRREVIPELLSDKGAADTVRIWAPGCSSGEEAYSIAILISEALTRQDVRPRVQIFATDIDEPMLQKARVAKYPHAALRDVPVELLDRYFFAQDDDFALVQSIKDMVRVSNHNLIKDPPFSRVDMVVCRNLLIYLNPALQQRLIPVFHYALRANGWLFLGSAENIASRADLFEAVDATARVFRRKGGMRHTVNMPLEVDPSASFEAASKTNGGISARDRAETMTRLIMEHYAPAHVVVDSLHDLLRSSTRTGRYLELAQGAPSSRITDLAKPRLRSPIRSVLEAAHRTGRRAIRRGIPVEHEDGRFLVNLSAHPLNREETLLIFQEATQRLDSSPDEEDADYAVGEDSVKHLEDELDATRLMLRTTVEELETSNEELKSTNEEMMSMNEELQSTNEELATVNEELKNKVDQLARANADLENFIESTHIPTIFLDTKLRIRSFTPATKALFRFQEQDKGRPLSDLGSPAGQPFEQWARDVLRVGQPVEHEFEDAKESYIVRVLPYVAADESIDGVVIVFTDVTKVRRAQEDLAHSVGVARQRSSEIETLYKTAPVGMALIDRNRRYLKINQQFADLSGGTMDAHIGRSLRDMSPGLFLKLDQPMADVFAHAREEVNLEVALETAAGGMRDFLVDVYPYEEDGRVTAVGLIFKDVTELRHLEKEMRRLMDELQHRVKNTLATVNSIINQTVGTKTDRADLAETLKSRIGALAATHDLLTTGDWQGASLRRIIEAELLPFGQSGRIALHGPNVELPPKHALALTLTLHELATNAAKYGALSKRGGNLDVTWMVTVNAGGRELVLDWSERVDQPLSTLRVVESFGMRLIKNAVAHDLKGACVHDLKPQGLNCRISFPF